ncbi:hypothetical protein GN109_07995 [Collimonas pratensis]|uniref:hypothetical protein n=1 Tax=Collimonas pratensis TaxID=279113 RepID=UPI00143D1BB9|nr:hypothetical protein [Collimonas pratensis]NKI69355.1 hypothetical protein [Collimonas pratensis]
MAQKISDTDALLLAQELRSFDLDETTSAARFIESLTFDAIFREEWERICGSLHQLHFYDRLADDIFEALEKPGTLENSVRLKIDQLLQEIEARYTSLLGEIHAHRKWIYKYMASVKREVPVTKIGQSTLDGRESRLLGNPETRFRRH